MSTFDSTKFPLPQILSDVTAGKIQLPDFQRGWIWDDEHVKSLLVSIARSFPVGAVMMLEAGGDVRFQVRPVENVVFKAGLCAKSDQVQVQKISVSAMASRASSSGSTSPPMSPTSFHRFRYDQYWTRNLSPGPSGLSRATGASVAVRTSV